MRRISYPWSDPTPLFKHGGVSLSGGRAVLDFSVNVNPLGPPQSVRRALQSGLDAVARYPDPECRALVERLAGLHRVPAPQILMGNGSNELIYTIARALQPCRVAIVEPAYTEYLRASLLAGARVEHWLCERADLQARPFDPAGASLIWLSNPTNPTGQLWPRAILREWIAAFPQTIFVVDEAFLPFLRQEADSSLIPLLDRLPNVIVLRSLTKLYTLPGLRLGYAVAGAALAGRLRAHLLPWSVNALAQMAGLAALDDNDFVTRTHAWLHTERAVLLAGLQALEAHCYPLPSAANFFLMRLHRATAGWLCRQLAERGLIVRDASNFIGLDSRYVRLAVRSAEDNQRLLAELRSLFLLGENCSCPARS